MWLVSCIRVLCCIAGCGFGFETSVYVFGFDFVLFFNFYFNF